MHEFTTPVIRKTNHSDHRQRPQRSRSLGYNHKLFLSDRSDRNSSKKNRGNHFQRSKLNSNLTFSHHVSGRILVFMNLAVCRFLKYSATRISLIFCASVLEKNASAEAVDFIFDRLCIVCQHMHTQFTILSKFPYTNIGTELILYLHTTIFLKIYRPPINFRQPQHFQCNLEFTVQMLL